MFKKKKSEDEEILTGEAELAAEETETELPVDEEPSAVEAAEAETDRPSEEGPGPESGEPDADKPENEGSEPAAESKKYKKQKQADERPAEEPSKGPLWKIWAHRAA
ncbi:MAG: hypothetical protein IKR53_02380, partial [Clostridia bacterium]|nr:hypothetical protein [Clostridia bacterium]